jgi:hypothetical protein
VKEKERRKEDAMPDKRNQQQQSKKSEQNKQRSSRERKMSVRTTRGAAISRARSR